MAGRPVQGSIVIANYTRDNWLKNLYPLWYRPTCVVSQVVHNKMPMLPSEETLLITAEEVWQLNFKVNQETRIASLEPD